MSNWEDTMQLISSGAEPEEVMPAVRQTFERSRQLHQLSRLRQTTSDEQPGQRLAVSRSLTTPSHTYTKLRIPFCTVPLSLLKDPERTAHLQYYDHELNVDLRMPPPMTIDKQIMHISSNELRNIPKDSPVVIESLKYLLRQDTYENDATAPLPGDDDTSNDNFNGVSHNSICELDVSDEEAVNDVAKKYAQHVNDINAMYEYPPDDLERIDCAGLNRMNVEEIEHFKVNYNLTLEQWKIVYFASQPFLKLAFHATHSCLAIQHLLLSIPCRNYARFLVLNIIPKYPMQLASTSKVEYRRFLKVLKAASSNAEVETMDLKDYEQIMRTYRNLPKHLSEQVRVSALHIVLLGS